MNILLKGLVIALISTSALAHGGIPKASATPTNLPGLAGGSVVIGSQAANPNATTNIGENTYPNSAQSSENKYPIVWVNGQSYILINGQLFQASAY